MKNFLAFFVLTLLTLQMASAQSPQSIPFQAVARDTSGVLLPNKALSLRISIHDSTSVDSVVYQETQSVTTNNLGLFTLSIGKGSAPSGSFSSINWATGMKSVQLEVDPTGGISYINLGTSQLQSVPFALYALSSGSSSITGPTGATGSAGATGFMGATGADGAVGSIGATGANGTNGSNGATGNDGANGTTGATGVTGNDGAAGSTGATGADGTVGPTGATGSTGTNGANGITGATGAEGITGATGTQGVTGATGSLSSGATAGNTPYWNGTEWIVNSSNIYNTGENIGIGTTSPQAKLGVNGTVMMKSTGPGSSYDYGALQLDSGGLTAVTLNVSAMTISTLLVGNYDNLFHLGTGTVGLLNQDLSQNINYGFLAMSDSAFMETSNSDHNKYGILGTHETSAYMDVQTTAGLNSLTEDSDGLHWEYQGVEIGTFPKADGAANAVLTTDGAGNWSWQSVVGTTGATGANGATGSNGVTGATGSAGSNGTNGATGADGIIGATGSNGTNGSNGVTGATGQVGATGSNGATGNDGATGPTGATGAVGATGGAGTTGATGSSIQLRNATADGQGGVCNTGVVGYIRIPFACTITGWGLTSDGTSPTCTWDIWKIASGTALPAVSNSIINTGAGGVKPFISTGNVNSSSTLTNWTTAVNAGDIIGYNLDANTIGTKITLTLTTTIP